MQAFLMKVKIIHDLLDFADVSSHILEEESTPVAQGKGKSLLIQSQIRLLCLFRRRKVGDCGKTGYLSKDCTCKGKSKDKDTWVKTPHTILILISTLPVLLRKLVAMWQAGVQPTAKLTKPS